MREQVSPGGMPVDPARVSRVGREITFRPNGRRPEGAIPLQAATGEKGISYLLNYGKIKKG